MRREVLFEIDGTYPANPSPFDALDEEVKSAILFYLTPVLRKFTTIPPGEVLFALHRQKPDLPWKALYLYLNQEELQADALREVRQLHTDALIHWGTGRLQEFHELLGSHDIEVHFEEAAT